MDVDDIKDEANRPHDAAGGDFHLARTVEKEARDICVHAMKQAYDLLPEFRLRDVPRMDIHSAIPALRSEARDNPLTRLPGSGPKQDYAAQVGSAPVSPTLRDIRMHLADLPPAKDGYWSPPSSDQDKREWIAANKEIIQPRRADPGFPRTWSRASRGRRSGVSRDTRTMWSTGCVSRPTPPGD
ncbi:hypothetical protein [Streptomyces sp. NPDC088180]|uniref:hypothetical protein n=1 Tax=Streptomyces sp. NPDC088180 TaxID=3365837 RepID=UPI003815279C